MLCLAAKGNHTGMVRLLLGQEVPIEASKNFGRKIKHSPARKSRQEIVQVHSAIGFSRRIALQEAASSGAEEVFLPLVNCGADINHEDDSAITPLYEAWQNDAIVKQSYFSSLEQTLMP